MINRLKKRISTGQGEGGFTLIELLVVLIIIAVLLAIAIPAYLGFKDRAEKRAAQSNVREAIPSMEAYGEDNNGVYNATAGHPTLGDLQGIDPAIKLDAAPSNVTANSYCITDTVGNWTAWFHRAPAGGAATDNVVQVVAKGGATC